jgi:ABC-2 type transport system ATP-binding protein
MEGVLPKVNMHEEPVNPVLEVIGVDKSYSGRPALVDFSMTIVPGSIHGLLGSNGSGKSTALHVITGIIDPDRGSVLHHGVTVSQAVARMRFGFAPDDLPLPQSLTGREYLRLHDSLRRRDDSSRAMSLARVLQVRNALSKPISSYSHGMKRKLQLVCALAHSPSLLILDEPFRGLDPDTAQVLQECLSLFTAAGGAVLMATHDLLRAETHCEAITMLHNGAIVASGRTREIVSSHGSVGQCFSARISSASSIATRADRLRALFTPDEKEVHEDR